mgnify:CR=1 FL=1
MSFGEKTAWITAIVTSIVYLAYLSTVLAQAPMSGPLSETPYVGPMVAAWIGSIVGIIALTITVSIASPRDAGVADERDAKILQRGEYLGLYLLATGSIAAAVLAMLEIDYFWIANVIYRGLVLSTLTSSVVQVAAYRRVLSQW